MIIVAHRYGSTLPNGVSYTEKEYDYAVSRGIPILGFVLEESVQWPISKSDTSDAPIEKLDAFKEKIKSRLVSFWRSSDDLYGKCAIALMKAFTAYPREGWVRASATQDVAASKELARLSAENATLREKVVKFQSENERGAKFKSITDVLWKNNHSLSVWKASGTDWEAENKYTLGNIFESLAPLLREERTESEISSFLATLVCGFSVREVRGNWPTPRNALNEILTSFAAYGLVEALASSDKKNAGATWKLTPFGADFLAAVKRARLESRAQQTDEKIERETKRLNGTPSSAAPLD